MHSFDAQPALSEDALLDPVKESYLCKPKTDVKDCYSWICTILPFAAIFRRLFVDVLHKKQLPDWYICWAWDCVICTFLPVTAVFIPFAISFVEFDSSRLFYDGWFATHVLLDIIWLSDMAMQTRVAYVAEDGDQITSRRHIFARYLRTTLLADVLALAPLDYVVLVSSASPQSVFIKTCKAMRLLKMLRMLRLWRPNSLLAQMHAWLGAALWSIVRSVCVGTLLLHVTACAFHWTAFRRLPGAYTAAPQPPQPTAMAAIMTAMSDEAAPEMHIGLENSATQWASAATWLEEYELQDASAAARYLVSMYWALATLTTTGFGDVTARTDHEQWLSCLAMLAGLALLSYFVSSVSSAAKLVNAHGNKVAKIKQEADTFVRAHRFPAELQGRVKAYAAHVAQQDLLAADERCLARLPPQLREDVLLCMHNDLLQALPFFAEKSTAFMLHVVQVLHTLVAPPGEFLVSAGEICECMFFVAYGVLARVLPHDNCEFEEAVTAARVAHLNTRACQSLSGFNLRAPPVPLRMRATDADASPVGLLPGVDPALYTLCGVHADGDHFAAESCILQVPSAEAVVARTFSRCVSLAGADLDAILELFPEYVLGRHTADPYESEGSGSEGSDGDPSTSAPHAIKPQMAPKPFAECNMSPHADAAAAMGQASPTTTAAASAIFQQRQPPGAEAEPHGSGFGVTKPRHNAGWEGSRTSDPGGAADAEAEPGITGRLREGLGGLASLWSRRWRKPDRPGPQHDTLSHSTSELSVDASVLSLSTTCDTRGQRATIGPIIGGDGGGGGLRAMVRQAQQAQHGHHHSSSSSGGSGRSGRSAIDQLLQQKVQRASVPRDGDGTVLGAALESQASEAALRSGRTPSAAQRGGGGGWERGSVRGSSAGEGPVAGAPRREPLNSLARAAPQLQAQMLQLFAEAKNAKAGGSPG
eukprot:jgi/Ulvmu1/12653/UM094_0009.1